MKHILVNEKAGEGLLDAWIRRDETVLVDEVRIAENGKRGDDIQGNKYKGCKGLALARY